MGLLKPEEKGRLIEWLLGLPITETRAGRCLLLDNLPLSLRNNIEDSDIRRVHLWSIVNAIDAWPKPKQDLPLIITFIERVALEVSGTVRETDFEELAQTLEARVPQPANTRPLPTLPPDAPLPAPLTLTIPAVAAPRKRRFFTPQLMRTGGIASLLVISGIFLGRLVNPPPPPPNSSPTPPALNTAGLSPTPPVISTVDPVATPTLDTKLLAPLATLAPTKTPRPPTHTPIPTVTPTRTPTDTPTNTPTDTPAPTDTATWTPTDTATPTWTPTNTPIPTLPPTQPPPTQPPPTQPPPTLPPRTNTPVRTPTPKLPPIPGVTFYASSSSGCGAPMETTFQYPGDVYAQVCTDQNMPRGTKLEVTWQGGHKNYNHTDVVITNADHKPGNVEGFYLQTCRSAIGSGPYTVTLKINGVKVKTITITVQPPSGPENPCGQ